eukprot:755145-Hanusia_phi.AAC.9
MGAIAIEEDFHRAPGGIAAVSLRDTRTSQEQGPVDGANSAGDDLACGYNNVKEEEGRRSEALPSGFTGLADTEGRSLSSRQFGSVVERSQSSHCNCASLPAPYEIDLLWKSHPCGFVGLYFCRFDVRGRGSLHFDLPYRQPDNDTSLAPDHSHLEPNYHHQAKLTSCSLQSSYQGTMHRRGLSVCLPELCSCPTH